MLKQNIIKYRLMETHKKLVRRGDLLLAREILHLLRHHKNVAGLDDVGCQLEIISQECGCNIRYGRNYNLAYISF